MPAEIRRTNATGGAKGDKLARFDQIPAEPMLELAYRYGLGSTKYPAVNGLDNWRNGYEFSLSIAALERHINAFKSGEDNDDTIYREAGLIGDDEDPLYDEEGKLRPGVSHLAAAAWHCFFLMYHLVHHPELDDRPSTVLSRRAEEAETLDGIQTMVRRLTIKPGPPATPTDRIKAEVNLDAGQLLQTAGLDLKALPTKRIGEWLEHYGIELIRGYLGTSYEKIHQIEFHQRLLYADVELEKSRVANAFDIQ